MIADVILETVRARIPLSSRVAARVRLVRRGKTLTGLCPFHREKTPSFTVDDEQGHYHCFGCGARGDIIDFVQHQEGLSFIEAVEQLAQSAGIALPPGGFGARRGGSSVDDAGRTRYEASLYEVMDRVCSWFQTCLVQNGAVMDYCRRRGLTEKDRELFRLGFAPAQGLASFAAQQGISSATLIAAGLMGTRTEDGSTYARFRDRLMFPIVDGRNRVIAFGGRALGDVQPKYLNSPETPLFSKGQTAYRAPAAALDQGRPTDTIVVVEGYMDVIAVSRWFPTLAPLGTALTEHQLALAWKRAPEPILCFDGDRAGQTAALKAGLLALGHLTPGHSVRIAKMPRGQDPQSLLAQGPEGEKHFLSVVQQAQPLCTFLYETIFATARPLTPEQRAGAMAQWRSWSDRIQDPGIRKAYRSYPYEQMRQGGTGLSVPKIPTLSPQVLHQRLLLGAVAVYPGLFQHVQEQLARLDLPPGSVWLHLCQDLLCWNDGSSSDDALLALKNLFKQHLGESWEKELETVQRHFPRMPATLEEVLAQWMDLFNTHQMHVHRSQEIASLKQQVLSREDAWQRLKHLPPL